MSVFNSSQDANLLPLHLTQSSDCDREDWEIRNLSRWASTQSSFVISLLKRKGLAAWSQLASEVGICESDTLMWILLFSVMTWQLLHCCALIMLDWNCLFNNREPLSRLVFNFLAALIPHHLPAETPAPASMTRVWVDIPISYSRNRVLV